MKNKIYTALVFLLLCSTSIWAEKTENDNVLKAIKLEADRNLKNLKKDSLQRPFFISVKLTDDDYDYYLKTSFGQISYERKQENISSRFAFVKICVGNYHRNAEGIGRLNIPIEDNVKALRTYLWRAMDQTYRYATNSYVNRMNNLKQEKQTEEDKALDDFEKREPVVLIQPTTVKRYDLSKARKRAIDLSKKLYKEVKKENIIVENINSYFSLSHKTIRYYDTEGSTYKFPQERIFLSLVITGVNKDGQNIQTKKHFSFKTLSQIDEIESDDKIIKDLINEYQIKYNAEYITEPYIGPVLLVGNKIEFVISSLINNLYTAQKTRYRNGNRYQKLKGARIISNQLSLKIDYSENAKNDKLLKRTLDPIDNEAVVAPDSIILIKNGKLLDMLTTRKPTKEYLKSNGNNVDSRYQLNGIVTLSGNSQYSYDELVKELKETAKIQGLEYAYILDNNFISKVNVETGKITHFRGTVEIPNIMKTLRRVIGTENKEIRSTDGSWSYPNSLLLEDCEVNVRKYTHRLKKDFVARPKVY